MKKFITLLCLSIIILSLFACSAPKESSLFLYAAPSGEEEYNALLSVLKIRLKSMLISEEQISFERVDDSKIRLNLKNRSLSFEEMHILTSDEKITFRNYNGDEILSEKEILSAEVAFDYTLIDGADDSGYYVKIILNDAGRELFSKASYEIAYIQESELRFVFIYYGSKLMAQPLITSKIMTSEIMLSGYYDENDAALDAARIIASLNPLPCPMQFLNNIDS